MNLPPIGILATGTYIPTPRMSSGDISEVTGIPRSIIEEKFGILEKPMPGPDDHPCIMGAKAAKRAIRRAKVDPLEIDAILSISEEHKEHPLMVSGIKIQQLIKAKNAWAIDIAQRSCTTIASLKLAKSLMQADPSLKTVLLAGGYRNCDLIDFNNPRVSFMYNSAAGGGAILLRRGHDSNILLGSSLISDGDFADDVNIPYGGTINPNTSDALGTGKVMLEVNDVEGMKARLAERSHDNFMKVIKEALKLSDLEEEQKVIDYLALLHMKRSAHTATLGELGLRLDQSFYLERYGHIGQFDSILSIERGVGARRIKAGDLVMMASAGIGYAWGAQAIRWG